MDVITQFTPREHVLNRPDTYVGSVQPEKLSAYVYDLESTGMVSREITVIPALYKIVDEILVNAADNTQRENPTTRIEVSIDPQSGRISVWNDGNVIPVRKHRTIDKWLPELAFGSLLTSDNYDDSKLRTTGGRNGVGATCTNILSTYFKVVVVDLAAKQKFSQIWTRNMAESPQGPQVGVPTKKDRQGVLVEFTPDYRYFGVEGLDEDTLGLLRRRVHDIAGTTGVAMKLDGRRFRFRTFGEYVKLFYPQTPPVLQSQQGRWQVVVVQKSPTDTWPALQFVNNVHTPAGGTHVRSIQNQVTKAVADRLKKTSKTPVPSRLIEDHYSVVVSCLVDNPTFGSQSKDALTLPATQFGSQWELDEKLVQRLQKSSLVAAVRTTLDQKMEKSLAKINGKKSGRLVGVPKLEDANRAGTRRSPECTLILTEGDSAKALAVAGLSVVGRDLYGVFPLKGKLINASKKKQDVVNNKEVQNLVKILGLQLGREYASTQELRYGHVMVMTDQDCDGSHIKGLVINLFARLWPSLLKIPGFLQQFITPVVKARRRGAETVEFYSTAEYAAWAATHPGYTAKYYKGLGTSTSEEARVYFRNLGRQRLVFSVPTEADMAALAMAFDEQVETRKRWITRFLTDHNYNATPVWCGDVNYRDFVDRELVHYAWASVLRAIPHALDGLKPGQRKVLWTLFQLPKKEMKVSQLMGIVSERAHYHHGEVSLGKTICRLAQNIVGKNNLSYLVPSGMFGTRLEGGNDCADPRYVFTELAAVTRDLFPQVDTDLLTQVEEDGYRCEFSYYLPVIPTVLLNGCSGIAVGYSCQIPPYHPMDLVEAMEKLCRCEGFRLEPYFEGFVGQTGTSDQGKLYTQGVITKSSENCLTISELPVGQWTMDYVSFLQTLVQTNQIKKFTQHHSETTVCFRVTVEASVFHQELEQLIQLFRLRRNYPVNLVLFSPEGKLKTYPSAEAITREFFAFRLIKYEERRLLLINQNKDRLAALENKVRFIEAVLTGTVRFHHQDLDAVRSDLTAQSFTDLDGLLATPISLLSRTRLNDLKDQIKRVSAEIQGYLGRDARSLWQEDLNKLKVHLKPRENRKRKVEA